MHTHTRVMAAASAVAVVTSLLTGCDLKDWSGKVSVEHQAPDPNGPNAPGASKKPQSAPSSAEPEQKTQKAQEPQKNDNSTQSNSADSDGLTHGTAAPRNTAKADDDTSASGGTASNLGTKAERKVVALVNAARKKAGCDSLRIDPRLRKAAYLHSRDMGLHHYFSHNSQNSDTPWDRIRAAGYTHPAAENIAAGQTSPTAVMDAWLHSEGHRANILNCDYKAIGVGLWNGGDTPVWTQDFGSA